MSRRPYKTQASSARVAFGTTNLLQSLPTIASSGQRSHDSQLSYVTEPPSLDQISDSKLVVLLKNLSKRDGTTKAKALDDILNLINRPEYDLDNSVVEAWTKLYARLSIENSRRVRQLAHNVNGVVSRIAGKRIARFMPQTCPPLLAGLYDNDKVVSKAAQEALSGIFPTKEKLVGVRKAYQQSIIQFCMDVINYETVDSLSDARTINADDAEAKYARTVATYICLLQDLLRALPSEDRKSHQTLYDNVFASEKLWTFVSDKDSFLAKSTCRLFQSYLVQETEVDEVRKRSISSIVLFQILNNPREGSIIDQSDTLVTLTKSYPKVWIMSFREWYPKIKSLDKFTKAGSRGRPTYFWINFLNIIKALPMEVLPHSVDSALELLNMVKEGVDKSYQSSADILGGWKIYVQIIHFVSSPMTEEDQSIITKVNAWPIIAGYVNSTFTRTEWETKPLEALEVIAEILKLNAMNSVARQEWPRITEILVVSIQTLHPEQSKVYENSQDKVISMGDRWSNVQRLLFLSQTNINARNELNKALMNILKTSLEVLETRNGKPFAAAGIVNKIITCCSEQISDLQPAQTAVASFVGISLPKLINSPSCKFLCHILYAQHGREDFKDIWNSTLNTALEDAKPQALLATLLNVSIMPPNFSLPKSHIKLQEFISKNIKLASNGHYNWNDLSFALHDINKILCDENQYDLMLTLLEALETDGKTVNAIKALKTIINEQNHDYLQDFLRKPIGGKLLSHVLLASESSNEEIAKESDQVQQQLRTISRDRLTGIDEIILDVIQLNLTLAAKSSLSIEKVIDLAKDQMEQTTANNNNIATRLMPPLEDWNKVLNYYMQLPPNRDLKVINHLGGAVSLIMSERDHTDLPDGSVNSKDNHGLTKLIRIAKYFAEMCHDSNAFQMVEKDTKKGLYKAFLITMQLVNDNVTLAGEYNLWDKNMDDVESEVLDINECASALFNEWSQYGLSEDYAFVRAGNMDLFFEAKGLSSTAFYNARVAATKTKELAEWHGTQNYQEFLPFTSKEVYRQEQEEAFIEAALITGLGKNFMSISSNIKICQKMVSTLTDMHINDKLSEHKALKNLVALNLTFIHEKAVAEAISKQRLVFLVKQLVSWIKKPISTHLQREIFELLVIVLPLIEDVYGSYWLDIMNFLFSLMKGYDCDLRREKNNKNDLPLLHSSLKLYATLRLLKDNDNANDDLSDSWRGVGYDVEQCLIALLKKPQDIPDDVYLPLKVFNELLCQQIIKFAALRPEDIPAFFALLNSQSKTIQQTAFRLLHESIPLLQEQISINAAIENKQVSLPSELISLLEIPHGNSYEGFSLTAAKGYLLAWILLFDHFECSSLRVRIDYIHNLKDGGYLTGFLDFMSEALGHNIGKPFDASKVNVKGYVLENDMSPLRDAQWLLSHIYYLSLVNVASIVKNWWLDCNFRQTVLSIESWTMKYMTPHVIEKALSVVTSWVESQDKESEDYLTVNVNSRVNEITASYPIDEQRISIVIKFPAAFPLSQALVEGVNRVAVEEKKWQAWLRSTQGVIAFQNNSIIDGLIAWRKNVVGALKGQTECAICYSIISADKQLPSKKCSTCKNFFHSSCLYKWFKSSNSSGCPLCRNPFKYG